MKKHPRLTLGTLYVITMLLLIAMSLESCATRSCSSYRSKPDRLSRIR